MKMSSKMMALLLAGGLSAGSFSASPSARACGCFTPPDPSVPVVQAGERILFSIDNGVVTAHIQIQYAGDAKDFGWLLPLPSDPGMLELGTDELFTQLTTNTQPKYRLNTVYNGRCGGPQQFNGVGGISASAPTDDNGETKTTTPLVLAASIGAYDYAVLKADSKDAMVQWLADNHYYVPVASSDVVDNYIHPGAFFLALKLKSGASAGDLQPVVVHYASDLPMIPIVLTSVAAQPHMGIQVWMLGEGRAIPRNYEHTVINDAAIDWLNSGQNYNDVIIRATGEADKHRSFVTEFAGDSTIMQRILDAPGRFGSQAELAALGDATAFLAYLRANGFGVTSTPNGFGPPQTQYTSAMLAVLAQYFPLPASVTAAQANDYYTNFTNYPSRPTYTFDPVKAAADLWTRVATPTLAAGALFRATGNTKLTRLYTTLSPEDMNLDPVFSFNPELPDYSNVHQATLTVQCTSLFGGGITSSLQTEQGFVTEFPDGDTSNYQPSTTLPASLRIEVLHESGAPVVLTDNASTIHASIGDAAHGCSMAPGAARSGGLLGLAMLLGNAMLVLALRRQLGRDKRRPVA